MPEGGLAGLAEAESEGLDATMYTSKAAARHRMVALGSTRLHGATRAADMTQAFQLERQGSRAWLFLWALLAVLGLGRGESSACPAAAGLMLRSESKALSLMGSLCDPISAPPLMSTLS